MPCFIEHLTSIVRIGAQALKWGDPWQKVVVVRWLSPKLVELIGFDAAGQRFTVTDFRSIEGMLSRLGVDEAQWTRKDADGNERVIRWKGRHDLYRAEEGEQLNRQAAGEAQNQ